ncbi:glycosyltransferase family 4 protein [Priestia megaterium]
MKIAIVVPIIGNFGRKGFYHSQEIGLGKEIAKNGHEVIVYKCVPLSFNTELTEEAFEGINVKYIPTRSIGPHGLFKTSVIDKDTDVVFAFSDTQLIIPRLYRYCKKNNIKFIPYVGIAHSFQRNIKSKIMDQVFKLTTLKIYKKVKVVTKTDHAKQELMSMGVQQCVVAPVGLDFSSLKADFEEYDRVKLREKWGFSAKDEIISFVARLQPEKCPLELIDIFKEIKSPNKKLLIVGDGVLKNKLKEKISINKLEEKVVLISQVKYEDMWQIHYIADFFINLRSDEIFGMAIMEAIYYKSSVIAISAPGPNTILENMKAHKICKGLKDISVYLERHKIIYNQLDEDKAYLVKDFSWSKCASYIKI